MATPDNSASPEARAELRRKLLKLRKRLRVNDALHFGYPKTGICSYARWHASKHAYNALAEGFSAWPKFSGSPAYPVPSTVLSFGAGGAYEYAAATGVLWKVRRGELKEYAALRRELLDFLIDYLK